MLPIAGLLVALAFLAPYLVMVLDALRPLGVKEFDMPASPSRVWDALQSAKA